MSFHELRVEIEIQLATALGAERAIEMVDDLIRMSREGYVRYTPGASLVVIDGEARCFES